MTLDDLSPDILPQDFCVTGITDASDSRAATLLYSTDPEEVPRAACATLVGLYDAYGGFDVTLVGLRHTAGLDAILEVRLLLATGATHMRVPGEGDRARGERGLSRHRPRHTPQSR